jgi:sec-independent protein translocase protein TatB
LMAGLVVAPTIQVASIGIPDTLFLMLLALVVFGPRRLPEIGRQIGKLMYEFRKVSNDFKFQMEEELRASEEADRQRKLAAASQVTLDVPPQPVVEAAPTLEITAGDTAETSQVEVPVETAAVEEEPAPAVTGEVRGEPRRFPHIQPPVSGEVIAAQKPFRGRTPEVATESGDEATRAVETPVVVADEGRIGTEVQPGVDTDVSTGTERAAHHA